MRPACALEHDSHECHHGRRHHGPAGVVEEPVREPDSEREREHQDRSPLAPDERGGPGQQERDAERVERRAALLRVRHRDAEAQLSEPDEYSDPEVPRNALQALRGGVHEPVVRAHAPMMAARRAPVVRLSE